MDQPGKPDADAGADLQNPATARYRRGERRQQPAHSGLAGELETGSGSSFVRGQDAAGKLLALGHKEHTAKYPARTCRRLDTALTAAGVPLDRMAEAREVSRRGIAIVHGEAEHDRQDQIRELPRDAVRARGEPRHHAGRLRELCPGDAGRMALPGQGDALAGRAEELIRRLA